MIVQYRTPPTEAHRQKVAARGGRAIHDPSLISATHYQLPAGALRDLEQDPEVVYVSPDRQVKAHLDQSHAAVNAQAAAQFGMTGAGVYFAVIDSGIGNVDDLHNNVVYNATFVNGGQDDNFGHGTHVAGILAGNSQDSTGSQYTRSFTGIAPGADLIALKVLDQNGNGTDSSVIQGIQAAMALKSQYNLPMVIHLSLGRPVWERYKLDPLCQAVEQAWKSGIVVVVAAGNFGRANPTTSFGYGTITAPGNDPYVITVGAMNDFGTIGCWNRALPPGVAYGDSPRGALSRSAVEKTLTETNSASEEAIILPLFHDFSEPGQDYVTLLNASWTLSSR